MELFDSHAHLDIGRYPAGGIDALLRRAFDGGVVGIVSIAGATRVGEWDGTFAIAEREGRIRVAVGIHPHTGSGATPSALDKLRFALDHERVVALGEIGLDYHYNHSPPADQRRAFVAQLRIARDRQLPIVIHSREAEADTIAILRDEGAEQLGGVLHCFSSKAPLAHAAVALGFFVSFSGIVTFPSADEVRAVAAELPADRVLAETDTPFLAPHPLRGRPNEPAHVRYVVEKLAAVRGIDPEEMASLTAANARRCFRIGPPHCATGPWHSETRLLQ